jgi:hypothetical protein
VCGGSRSAYRRICDRERPAFRSPEKLAEDVGVIGTFSRAPIFMVHDPRMGGMRRAVRFFSLLESMRPANEMVFELYYPAGDDFFEMLTASVPTWSIEITLESPDEALRKRNGKFPWSNTVVEETIERALAHGCRKLDVFFMTGLPGQRYQDALAIADYCEHLLDRFGADGRLHPFVAPLGPFLDPGCRAFEQSSFGYTTFCRTLEDHRQALLQHGWHKILSYETTGMTRDEIVRATYDVAERLNDLKHKHRLIDDRTFADVRFRLNMARQIVARAGEDDDVSGPAAELANHRTMFGDDELKWPLKHGFRVGTTLLRSLAAGLVLELRHTAARLVDRYDVAPASASGP